MKTALKIYEINLDKNTFEKSKTKANGEYKERTRDAEEKRDRYLSAPHARLSLSLNE